MALLNVLPFDLIVSLLNDWLEVGEVVRLDSACCCDERKILLNSFSMKQVVMQAEDIRDTTEIT